MYLNVVKSQNSDIYLPKSWFDLSSKSRMELKPTQYLGR